MSARRAAIAPLRGAWIAWQCAIGIMIATTATSPAIRHHEELVDGLIGSLVIAGLMELLALPLTVLLLHTRLVRPITDAMVGADDETQRLLHRRLLRLGILPVFVLVPKMRRWDHADGDPVPTNRVLGVFLVACACAWLLVVGLVVFALGWVAVMCAFIIGIGTLTAWGILWSEP